MEEKVDPAEVARHDTTSWINGCALTLPSQQWLLAICLSTTSSATEFDAPPQCPSQSCLVLGS